MVWTPTFVFRLSCLYHVGLMDIALVRSQDVDFYILLPEKYKMATMGEPLVNIYLILNKNLAKISGESRRILLAKHTELIESLGSFPSSYVYAMGDLVQAESFSTDGQLDQGLNSFKSAIRHNPFLPLRRYMAIPRHLVKLLFTPAQR